MTLRRKFILYLGLIHLAFAASALFFLVENRAWLLVVEAFFILSLICGIRFIQALFAPLDLIQTGTELIDESDFTCRFREVGQPEIDRMIRVYNRMVDKNQMEQVFLNILKNAIEAIGEGGNITIRMGEKSGREFITVEDTGCGIAPETRPNLFTPFFSTKPNGQGIGLTLVQEILSRHGFDFSLDGPPGGPTRFTIYF